MLKYREEKEGRERDIDKKKRGKREVLRKERNVG